MYFFFFQAEDGIRDVAVTGVQTCALPICRVSWVSPIARALLRAREGDAVTLSTPAGDERLEVFEIRYEELDRKSTRLNSSHGYISYAVFCLKKKKKTHLSTPGM